MCEFQAVVMALGHGSRMTDLTSYCPKPLLPVGNYPMIWYPLHSLEVAGFDDAIVITSEGCKSRIQKELAGKLKLKLEVVDIPDEEWGTAESLKYILDRIKSDVLVISCDLIMDLDLKEFVMLHRYQDSALTALFVPFMNEVRLAAPGYKNKSLLEHDFVGIDSKFGQLLFIRSEADFIDNFTIRKNIKQQHPNFKIYSNLLDAHLYLMKKSVLEFEIKHTAFSSLKGELMPHILKKQFQSVKQKCETELEPKDTHSLDPISEKKTIGTYQLLRELTSSRDFMLDDNKIRCFGFIADKGFCIRANTISSYYVANKKLMHLNIDNPRIDSSADRQNARIDSHSFVAAHSVIGSKSVIKLSTIGPNCKIGEKIQLTSSLIMNNVSIGDGCQIEGCIVADGVQIGSGCKLKDCLVTANVKVDENVKMNKELISDGNQMMEIE